MQYTARFTNRDGSIDIDELGDLESDALAMSKARTALFVSLAAVSVDVTSNGVRVGHVRREVTRAAIPHEARRFFRGMAPLSGSSQRLA